MALDVATDRRERACRLRDACRCTHTACRDGWLDEDVPYVRHGRTYAGVRRCPVCWASWQGHVR